MHCQDFSCINLLNKFVFMYDSHFHLTRLPAPQKLLNELLASEYNGESSACEPAEWDYQKKLLQGQSRILASYGIHPMSANCVTGDDLKKLESLIVSTPQASVGECGIDRRFTGYAPNDIQEAVFRAQVAIAIKYKRKLVFHIVGDHRRIFKILDEMAVPPSTEIYFHRFNGDIEIVALAKQYDSTFGNPRHPDAILKVYGNTERIVFETDADEGFCQKDTPAKEVILMLKDRLLKQQAAISSLHL